MDHSGPKTYETISVQAIRALNANMIGPTNVGLNEETVYHDMLRAEEAQLDFELQHFANETEKSPEELVFIGANAFYSENYPMNQTEAVMTLNYAETAHGNNSSNITSPNGLVGTQTAPSNQTYFQLFAFSDTGDIRYDGSPDSQLDENQSKRARNTAASARFRAKKKERERELGRSTKVVRDTVTKLEAKITQLETENRWLKDLMTGKIKMSTTEKEQGRDIGDKGGEQVLKE